MATQIQNVCGCTYNSANENCIHGKRLHSQLLTAVKRAIHPTTLYSDSLCNEVSNKLHGLRVSYVSHVEGNRY